MCVLYFVYTVNKPSYKFVKIFIGSLYLLISRGQSWFSLAHTSGCRIIRAEITASIRKFHARKMHCVFAENPYLILTNKMLRFEILFSSCRNSYKRSNHFAERDGFQRLFELGNHNFHSHVRICRVVIAESACARIYIHAVCTSPVRDKRAPVASRQRNAEN